MSDKYDTSCENHDANLFDPSNKATMVATLAGPIAAAILAKLAPDPSPDILEGVAARANIMASKILQDAQQKHPPEPAHRTHPARE